MSDLIYIDQTLHGYADGHQLLATSTDLTSAEQSSLLITSDLSGPAFREGYDTYLTGYPLPGGTFYCLARTWFAPELPRPGCVWTQSFLIKMEDIARITCVDCLNAMFQRPTSSLDSGAYSRRLALDPQLHSASQIELNGIPTLKELYGDKRNAVIFCDNSRSYEPLVLAIFEQQWPKLRRSFRFCTGSLSLRGNEFDLSVSPPEAKHSIGANSVSIPLRLPFLGPEDEWLNIANDDLVTRKPRTDYRTFLWHYGPDTVDGRAAFRPLTEIFSLLKSGDSEPSSESLLAAIGHFYPEPSAAQRLKANLFGKAKKPTIKAWGEANILRLLVSHPQAASIPSNVADVRDRAYDLLTSDVDAAVHLAMLASELGGPHAEAFLEGFFDSEDLSSQFIQELPPTLLALSLKRYPALITRVALWLRPDRVDLLGTLLSILGSDAVLLRETIDSMIAANAWDAVSIVIAHCGLDAISAVFEIIEDDASEYISYSDSLFSDLTKNGNSWLELARKGLLGPRSLKFLSAELDPRAWHVRQLGTTTWIEATKSNADFSSPRRKLRSSIFFLSLSLSLFGVGAALLAREGFRIVYKAAESDKIEQGLWDQLEPNLSWYRPSWDKCARLIRSVARAFKDKDWDPAVFFDIFSASSELHKALQELDDTIGGRRYIAEMKRQLNIGQLELSSEQRRALDII